MRGTADEFTRNFNRLAAIALGVVLVTAAVTGCQNGGFLVPPAAAADDQDHKVAIYATWTADGDLEKRPYAPGENLVTFKDVKACKEKLASDELQASVAALQFIIGVRAGPEAAATLKVQCEQVDE